jgi:hypothetical protein
MAQFILIAFLLFPLQIQAQHQIAINEYGAYFFKDGVLKKIEFGIPMDGNIMAGFFWNNYIIFGVASPEQGEIIYNTENGSLSNILRAEKPTGKGGFKPLDKGPNLFFYFGGWEYELDPVTLRTINRRDAAFDGEWYDWSHLRNDDHSDYHLIGRTYRFDNRTFIDSTRTKTVDNTSGYYLDVTFGPNIDFEFLNYWGIPSESRGDQFVILVGRYHLRNDK